MFALLRGFALSDERIRAMWLNGSRANPDADKDVFMDYDVVCAVTDLAPFVDATDFLQRFGEIAVMQEPEGPPYRENKSRERYAYLMQFADVNRIDLGFVPMETALAEYGKDSQTLLLLDKDGVLPAIPPPSDRDYRVKRPTAQEFAACLGEFRWVAPYVAKGIRRGEPTYAQAQMNGCVRPELLKMLSWKPPLPPVFKSARESAENIFAVIFRRRNTRRSFPRTAARLPKKCGTPFLPRSVCSCRAREASPSRSGSTTNGKSRRRRSI